MNPTIYRHIARNSRILSDAEVDDWVIRVESSGATVSASTKAAAVNFMLSVKAAGLRSKLYRVNLFAGSGFLVGTNFGSLHHPLIKDKGAAFDSMTGTIVNWVYNETGASGGLTAGFVTMNTGLIPQSDFPDNTSGHVMVYAREVAATGNPVCGCQRTTSPNGSLYQYCGPLSDDTVDGLVHDFNADVRYTDAAATGFFLTSRESATIKAIYNNSIQKVRNTSSVPVAHTNDQAFHMFTTNVSANPCTNPLAGYSIGLGLVQSEVETYFSIWDTFQTALGRNV
jgi:hypothetical protein